MNLKSLLYTLSAVSVLSVLSPAEEVALFDGRSLEGWQDKKGDAPKWVVEDGSVSRKEKGTGDIWTKKRYGDFKLSLEFKTEGNSGVFIRTDDPKKNVQTGIEIQVDVPCKPGRHSVGAIYDLVAPSKDNTKADEWNEMVVIAKGSMISVAINGEVVSKMDLDQWTEPRKNPDGSKNKFKTALKDFKREGHIGFQDHGKNVAYRKVRIETFDAGAVDEAKRVNADMETLATVLKLYKARTTQLPTTAQGLQALASKPKIAPVTQRWVQLVKDVPKDPWGLEYQYVLHGEGNPKRYDLISAGPDGKFATADDIVGGR